MSRIFERSRHVRERNADEHRAVQDLGFGREYEYGRTAVKWKPSLFVHDGQELEKKRRRKGKERKEKKRRGEKKKGGEKKKPMATSPTHSFFADRSNIIKVR